MIPDLINPLDGMFARVRHGPMHRFSFLRSSDYSGYEVELLLRQYGIRIWGREVDDKEEIAFLVKDSQAQWAEYILARRGIPLTSPLLDERHHDLARQHAGMPTPWDEKGVGPQGLIDHVLDWMDKVLP